VNKANRDPYLLTPGPLTTSADTKAAMLHDWGSRDAAFIDINRRVLDRLVELANGQNTHVAVPLQGSGTFAVEAMVATFLPRDGKALILINGAYGHRIATICDYLGRAYSTYETDEDVPPDPEYVAACLADDPAITYVIVVHCETTSGILNPVADVAAVTAAAGRRLLIDSMSAFGALPMDAGEIPFDALAASANKCLEGVPGIGFVLCRKEVLIQSAGNAHSLSLDLIDQWTAMDKTGQWRFTPPTHVVVAFEQALREHEAEGGVAGRYARYRENCDILVSGMRARGFTPLLDDSLQAPIIVTFHMPDNPKFEFGAFYDRLQDKGYVIYPGKLTKVDSFRIGCIGRLGAMEMQGALKAIDQTLTEMGVQLGKVPA
jgi:2-aminoethylphosphonate-pyruvate transaminase